LQGSGRDQRALHLNREMADLIGAAGFEIECHRGRVHAGATALDIHVSGFGDELIFGPGVACGLSGTLRFSVLC